MAGLVAAHERVDQRLRVDVLVEQAVLLHQPCNERDLFRVDRLDEDRHSRGAQLVRRHLGIAGQDIVELVAPRICVCPLDALIQPFDELLDDVGVGFRKGLGRHELGDQDPFPDLIVGPRDDSHLCVGESAGDKRLDQHRRVDTPCPDRVEHLRKGHLQVLDRVRIASCARDPLSAVEP